MIYWYTPNPAPLSNAFLAPNGSFDWTPQMSEIGTYSLTFWATDQSSDSSATKQATVAVFRCGDLNSDASLTPADVVLELNAVFLGSNPPAPFEASDLNGDGQRTPADVVLELNAVFLGSPANCS